MPDLLASQFLGFWHYPSTGAFWPAPPSRGRRGGSPRRDRLAITIRPPAATLSRPDGSAGNVPWSRPAESKSSQASDRGENRIGPDNPAPLRRQAIRLTVGAKGKAAGRGVPAASCVAAIRGWGATDDHRFRSLLPVRLRRGRYKSARWRSHQEIRRVNKSTAPFTFNLNIGQVPARSTSSAGGRSPASGAANCPQCRFFPSTRAFPRLDFAHAGQSGGRQ